METVTLIIVLFTIITMMFSVVFFPSIVIHFRPEKHISINMFWMISFIGAVLLVSTKCISLDVVTESMFKKGSINPFKILILFYSMTIISIILDEYGFFSYVASLVATKYKKSQKMLLICFYICVSILTVFTSNDIIILTFTPFICMLCKKMNINPMPYLISEFVAANTLSMMLIIGNPTNIYLGSFYGVTFFEYLSVMALPTIAAAIVVLLFILFIFRKDLNKQINVDNIEVESIKDKRSVIISTIILLVCIVLLTITSYINVEMYLISLVLCSVLLVYSVVNSIIENNYIVLKRTFKRVPYELCIFVLSMFVIVQALNMQGILNKLGTFFINLDNEILSFGFSSFIFSNLMNNIPMSVMYSEMIASSGASVKALYSSVVGSNIGAYLTPLGSLAGIMWLGLLKKEKVKISFPGFIKYAAPISIISISVTLGVLLLIM